MIFLFMRLVSVFLVVFVFSLISYVAWKKLIRPALLKEKIESELIDASEAFQEKRAKETAEKIANGEEFADEQ